MSVQMRSLNHIHFMSTPTASKLTVLEKTAGLIGFIILCVGTKKMCLICRYYATLHPSRHAGARIHATSWRAARIN